MSERESERERARVCGEEDGQKGREQRDRREGIQEFLLREVH